MQLLETGTKFFPFETHPLMVKLILMFTFQVVLILLANLIKGKRWENMLPLVNLIKSRRS